MRKELKKELEEFEKLKLSEKFGAIMDVGVGDNKPTDAAMSVLQNFYTDIIMLEAALESATKRCDEKQKDIDRLNRRIGGE